ncbi:MAG: TIGR00268 family protein, partial [Deltaproteobacteria bacterium]|nr:TIGR00268 family protein [Deltaproteobacteria bacterium]
KTVRVRLHGDMARIEVSAEERERLFDTELLDRIAEDIKDFGFTYVTLDLQGYRMGSLNEGL